MKINRKIKVLVVDDSMVFREVLARGIATDPYIEVVATAQDPFDARDKIIEYQPDVMTCDVEMPKMNGIEFIRRLLPQYPLPVIVVSTISQAVFEAMDAGAVDFVTKPDVKLARNVEGFLNDLIIKIKIASIANVSLGKKPLDTGRIDTPQELDANRVIAIGASTGGTEAIHSILKTLPQNVPGIVIVQHIPPIFSRMFAERLNNSTSLEVKEAKTGDVLVRGRVLISPGDQHMRLKKMGGKYSVECYSGEKVSGHCPAVDVLFESVAKEVGPQAIGVILTGMGYDGAKGLLAMRRKGARTLGQDQQTSVVYGMPKAAFELGAVEKQVPIASMAQQLVTLLR